MSADKNLPPLPDGVTLEELLVSLRAALETCHDTDWSLRQFKTSISHALAALAQQAQEPWGWAIEDKHGVAQAIRPSRKEFFGCIQATEPFTVEDGEKMGREWPGLAPHRIVKLYTAPPAPQPAPVDERDELEADMADKAAVMPAAVVAEVYQSRYTIEWVNGPMPTGTNLYAGPKVVKAWAEEVRKLRAERDALAALSQPAPAPHPAVPVVSDEQIDAATRHMYHNGRPTTKEYRVGIVRAILALRPAGTLTGCNCRWDGETQIEWCELHLAHKDAIHDWAERAKSAEQKLAMRPAVEPMTDEVRRSYQCLLAMNTPHGFGDRIGPFVKWLQDSGITAKAGGVRDGRST